LKEKKYRIEDALNATRLIRVRIITDIFVYCQTIIAAHSVSMGNIAV